MGPRLAGGRGLTWCGELSHDLKVELIQGARALLFPIDWDEPFGLVMIEALLVGTPVIAFARGSAPEVIEEGVTGFLVNTAEEMATRIRQLDRIDRARCRARAEKRWSGGRMASQYVHLYEELTHHPKRSRIASSARVVPMHSRKRTARPIELEERLVAGMDHGAKAR
jgi:glycosyltransferase involved in cell wall biosynthesis